MSTGMPSTPRSTRRSSRPRLACRAPSAQTDCVALTQNGLPDQPVGVRRPHSHPGQKPHGLTMRPAPAAHYSIASGVRFDHNIPPGSPPAPCPKRTPVPAPTTHVMNGRVTQTDIAKRAGVHSTTVSLALRNHPSLPAETRKRLQDLAEANGLSARPRSISAPSWCIGRAFIPKRPGKSTLAYVTNWETQWGWKDFPAHA